MNSNTKLEVAVEILASKIAQMSEEEVKTGNKKILNLLKEREKMYSGDEETINKIIEIYGKEIKSYMER